MLVLDEPSTNPSSYSHVAWTGFAATSAGDRRADVHYKVDWAGAAAAYRKALRRLWRERAVLAPAEYAQRLKDLKIEHAVATRSVWVQDSTTRTATWAMFSADPLTRRPSRVKYVDLMYGVGLPPTPDHTDSWRVWELATQLRAAMESRPGIRVSDEVRDGVSGYRIDVPAGDGAPAWSSFVDKSTGLTLSVTRATAGGGGGVLSPYHVRDLRVNEPPAPYSFVVRPDYRKLPGLRGGTRGQDARPRRWRNRGRLAPGRRARVGGAAVTAGPGAIAGGVHALRGPRVWAALGRDLPRAGLQAGSQHAVRVVWSPACGLHLQ
jgi:hypothetical protein